MFRLDNRFSANTCRVTTCSCNILRIRLFSYAIDSHWFYWQWINGEYISISYFSYVINDIPTSNFENFILNKIVVRRVSYLDFSWLYIALLSRFIRDSSIFLNQRPTVRGRAFFSIFLRCLSDLINFARNADSPMKFHGVILE